jgi:subtilisin family serine protease
VRLPGLRAHILRRVQRLRLTLGVLLVLSLLAPAGLARAAAAPPATGNVLVLLERHTASAAAVRFSVRARVASLRGRFAGLSVPQIGLLTVRPPPGMPAASFADALAQLPGVASATLEHRYVPRFVPNDPALHAADPGSGVVQWALARENLYSAWDISRGNGALVGVIDTGVDASHPDLAGKIAVALDQQDPADARGTATTDEVGHGTHVASLACAGTNNGIGMAGAGYDCRLVVEKSDFTDSSIAASIVDAADRHVGAINMSFGPAQPAPNSAPASEIRALDYAAGRGVVLVAAAADQPGSEQGDPANALQPAGTGPNLTQGLGLDVTAADFSSRRASFAGFGSEISLAAYGAFEPDAGGLLGLGGPVPGIFGAFPAGPTDLEAVPDLCGCRTTFQGSDRYAYLQGTSMAAPQVAAVAAMMRTLNPYASVSDVLITLKATATRPAGTGWSSDLGWGILNAGGALDAIRRVDRLAPVSKLTAPRVSRHRVFTLHWSGHDRRYGGLIPSGIAHYDVYAQAGAGAARVIAVAAPSRHSLRYHARAGTSYRFYTVAVDHSGNRESKPVTATTRVVG